MSLPAVVRVSPRLRIGLEVALVVLVAAAMGFTGIDRANIGPDELIYQEAGLAYVTGDLSPNPEHPPVAKVLLGLWQLAFGIGITSARALMGVVLVACVLVAYAWMRAAFGGATAVIGALLLATTSRVNGADFIDRQVLLDPFGVLFAMAGLAVLWQWERRRRLPLAIVAGMLMALAMLSKASAATAVVAALAVVPWRELRRPAVWGAMLAFAATGVAVCLLAFAPFGGLDAVAEMIDFQAGHAAKGHPIVVAGVEHQHAPWFSVLWFGGEVLGPAVLAAIAFWATLAASLRWRVRAARVLVLAVAAPLVALSASPVALPHYTAAWLWPLLLLSAAGVTGLWTRARSALSRTVVLAAAATLLIGPVAGVVHVATLRPTGVALVDAAMAADPAPDGTVLTVQLSPLITRPNIDAPVTTDPEAEDITAIVVGDDVRFTAPHELLDIVDAIEEPVRLDGLVVYLLDAPLDELLDDTAVVVP